MVIYYLFAFDHKLLNLKNINGTKTELCIYIFICSGHTYLLSACCVPGTAAPKKIWNIIGEIHFRKDRSFLWVRAVLYKPSECRPCGQPVSRASWLRVTFTCYLIREPPGAIVPVMRSSTCTVSWWHFLPSSLKDGPLQRKRDWRRNPCSGIEHLAHPKKGGESPTPPSGGFWRHATQTETIPRHPEAFIIPGPACMGFAPTFQVKTLEQRMDIWKDSGPH